MLNYLDRIKIIIYSFLSSTILVSCSMLCATQPRHITSVLIPFLMLTQSMKAVTPQGDNTAALASPTSQPIPIPNGSAESTPLTPSPQKGMSLEDAQVLVDRVRELHVADSSVSPQPAVRPATPPPAPLPKSPTDELADQPHSDGSDSEMVSNHDEANPLDIIFCELNEGQHYDRLAPYIYTLLNNPASKSMVRDYIAEGSLGSGNIIALLFLLRNYAHALDGGASFDRSESKNVLFATMTFLQRAALDLLLNAIILGKDSKKCIELHEMYRQKILHYYFKKYQEQISTGIDYKEVCASVKQWFADRNLKTKPFPDYLGTFYCCWEKRRWVPIASNSLQFLPVNQQEQIAIQLGEMKNLKERISKFLINYLTEKYVRLENWQALFDVSQHFFTIEEIADLRTRSRATEF